MATKTYTIRTTVPGKPVWDMLMQRVPSILDCRIPGPANPIHVERKRNVLRNRWAMTADLLVDEEKVAVSIDGAGTMHDNFFAEIRALFPDEWVEPDAGPDDPHGILAAKAEMHSVERVSAWLETGLLEQALDDGEQVEFLGKCEFQGHNALVILTDKRLLITEFGLFHAGGAEIDPTILTAITTKMSLSGETVTVNASGAKWEAKKMIAGRGGRLAELLRAKAAAAKQAQAAPAAGGDDVAGQLARLAELHGQGVLSDDEFAAAKARIIGG